MATRTNSSFPARRRLVQHPGRVAIIVVGLLLAANLAVFAVVQSDTNPVGVQNAPTAIQQLTPEPGALIQPQDTVSVDLVDTFTGVIKVDGVEIPEDQLTRIIALGEVAFRPGPGREFDRWSPGTHTAAVIFWPQTKTRASATGYTWQFKVG